jgi:hypothetical protein
LYIKIKRRRYETARWAGNFQEIQFIFGDIAKLRDYMVYQAGLQIILFKSLLMGRNNGDLGRILLLLE